MTPAAPRPPRLVVVVGPTAAGKTALALRLAEAAGGEVVSADSQQVYAGMDIGTGKASAAERARVRHHLIDVVGPDEVMTAARFVALADAAIADAAARGTPVVVCGGTGLYVRALLYGLFAGPAADPALRARLEAAPDPAALRRRLEAVDPAAAARIDPRDRVRTIRALEVHELTGVPISAHQQRHDHRTLAPRHPVRVIGLAPPRAELHVAIDARVDGMIAAGLVDEVRRLSAAPGRALEVAIGYRQISAYLQGKSTLPEAVAQIKRATRRYARRQLAWFRAEPGVTWYKSPRDVDVAATTLWLRGEAEAGNQAGPRPP